METPHVGQGTDNCLAVSSFFRIWKRMQQDVRKKLFNLEHNQFEFLGTNLRKLQYVPRENVLLASNDHPSVTTPTGNRDACQPPIHELFSWRGVESPAEYHATPYSTMLQDYMPATILLSCKACPGYLSNYFHPSGNLWQPSCV